MTDIGEIKAQLARAQPLAVNEREYLRSHAAEWLGELIERCERAEEALAEARTDFWHRIEEMGHHLAGKDIEVERAEALIAKIRERVRAGERRHNDITVAVLACNDVADMIDHARALGDQ